MSDSVQVGGNSGAVANLPLRQPSVPEDGKARLAIQLKSIYDDYRTALFNELYYSERVEMLDRWRLAFDITIALLATTSPVAGWAVWKHGSYINLWAALAGFGAIIAIIAPLLKLTDRVKSASELKTGYTLLFFDLRAITQDVLASRDLSQINLELYKAAGKRMGELTAKDDSNPSSARKKELQRRVNAQLPPSSLWMP